MIVFFQVNEMTGNKSTKLAHITVVIGFGQHITARWAILISFNLAALCKKVSASGDKIYLADTFRLV